MICSSINLIILIITIIMMQEVTVQGWVRTSRFAENHNIMFVELTDGSTVRGMQLVLIAATTVVRTFCFYYAVL
jgi:aspartyl/asparaginyl-tRNA synthetase